MRFANHPQRSAANYGNRLLTYLQNHATNGTVYTPSTDRQTVEVGNTSHTDVFVITEPGGFTRLWIPKVVAKVEVDVPYSGTSHARIYADKKLIPEQKLKGLVEKVKENGF